MINGPSQRRPAFSLIELLITISIILILAALLFPTLTGAKERARRKACANNLRQFTLLLHLYATDASDQLPSGFSEMGEREANARLQSGRSLHTGDPLDEHVPLITPAIRKNLIQLASGSEKPLRCPTLPAPFTNPGGFRFEGFGIVLGYNYLGGHYQTPWTTTSYATNQWTSPRKLADDPQLALIADPNTFTFSERAAFIPHTARGAILVGGKEFGLKPDREVSTNAASAADLHPKNFGAQGGNVANLDGSLRWKKLREMKIHIGSSQYGNDGALCLW